MKILLQNTRTLKFISKRNNQSGECWTTELGNARVFATPLEALYHCYRREITNMQMFAAFVGCRQHVTVSLTDGPMVQEVG